MVSSVERLKDEIDALLGVVTEHGGLSERAALDQIKAKSVVLAAASYFERVIQDIILGTLPPTPLHPKEFLKKQALERKYHAMFDWEKRNANKFFSLFGSTFLQSAKDSIRSCGIESSIESFMEIGSLRNRLVHEDFAQFDLQKTPDEVWELFQSARKFPLWFEQFLKDYT